MPGLIWAATPLGVLHFDTGNPSIPFTRCEVRSWLDFGIIWDSLPRPVQRALEADGIGRRSIEEPFVLAYFQAARAAGV